MHHVTALQHYVDATVAQTALNRSSARKPRNTVRNSEIAGAVAEGHERGCREYILPQPP